MRVKMNEQLRAAAQLLEQGHYLDAANAYRTITETQPESAAIAASQVGAALFFLRNFTEAIQWYEYAARLGCDPRMIEENIREARDELDAAAGDGEVAKGGGPILRHDTPVSRVELVPAHADPDWVSAIEAHFGAHVGPVASVFHEIVSDVVHVDVHVIPASRERDHHVLFTTGCSALPMEVPEGSGASPYAEFMVLLPAWWKLAESDWREERWYWPVRWLKILARLPHEYRTWVGWGHTIPNDDPLRPFDASTELSGVLLLPSVSHPEARAVAMPDGRTVDLWTIYPVHAKELDYKLELGPEALIERFEAAQVWDVIDPARPSVVGPTRSGLL